MKKLKKFAFFSLLLFAWNSNIFAGNDKSLWQIIIGIFVDSEDQSKDNYQQQPSYHYENSSNFNSNKKVDYGRVRQEFRSAFDNILATSYQTQADQNEIKKNREKSSNEVIHRLQTQYGNLSEPQSKNKARQLARSAALEFIGERTEQIVYHEISRIRQNPPINPTHLQPVDRDYLMRHIKQEMLREAGNRVSDQYGSLREYAGEQLRRKINFKVEQAFGIHDKPAQSVNYNQDPYAHLPAWQRPSAPLVDEPAGQSTQQGIKEIYPKNAGAHMTVFKDELCCSCQEDFNEIGKRVILQCGHTICPECIYQWLYGQNKNTCPTCRATINKDEFPSNYLRQNI